MDSRGQGDIARDSQGRPILDRYGRPVRRRPQPGQSASGAGQRPRQQFPRQQQPPRQQTPRRQEPPRQYIPPQAQQTPVGPQPGQVGHVYQPTQQPILNAQQPAPQKRGRRRRSIKLPGCLASLAWFVAIILVITIGGTLWVDSQLNRVDASPDGRVANTAGTNWLLVGSDSREGLSDEDINRLGTGGDLGVGRTDTVMLLHIPRGGSPTLVSIPRDSYVNVPGWGMDKVNSAFSIGGPELLVQTVEEATSLRIDHYAEIGMGGMANMVDAVGGVEMCPTEAIQDPLANLDIQAGCQEFDGAQALGYVRTRATAQGDLDRVVRQREFFSQLLDTATSPSTLLNPFRLFPMISDGAATFTVGTGDHVWHMARLALAMRGGMTTETVPIGGFADYNVGSVVLWDEAGAEALWSSMR